MPSPAESPQSGVTTPRLGILPPADLVSPKHSQVGSSPAFREALAQLELAHAYEIEQVRGELAQNNRIGASASSRAPPSRIPPLFAFQPEMSTQSSECSAPLQPSHHPTWDVTFLSDGKASKWADIVWSLSCSTAAQFSILNHIWVPNIHLLASQTDLSHGFSKANMLELVNKPFRNRPQDTYLESTHSLALKGNSSNFHHDFLQCWCSPLHPAGITRLSWDLLGMSLCVYEIVALPLILSSLAEQVGAMSLISCIFWTLDIGATFMTSHFTYDGAVEARFSKISKVYCKSWFVFDFALSVTDWIMFLAGDFFVSSRAVASALRFARTMRLLRILKLFPRFRSQVGRVTSHVMFSSIRLCGYIIAVVVFNHYLACLWCATWSHRGRFDGERENSTMYKYFTGLHWSFAHCLLGSMDISPADTGERMFTCIVLVISLVVFSILLSMITNDALELRAVVHDRNAKTAHLLSFFSHRKLPAKFVCKMWHYVHRRNLLDSNRPKHDTAKQSVDLFPPHVQAEIRIEWFRPLLIKHPFFRMYDFLEPSCTQTLCSEFITFRSLMHEEHLVWSKSTAVSQMIFVENGCLEYRPWDRSLDPVAIGPGMWACEEALWSSTARIAGHMQTGHDFCDLILITREGFAEVARSHPSSLLAVMRYAREFVKAFNHACNDHSDAEVLFNDQKVVSRIITAANTVGSSLELPLGDAMSNNKSSI